MAEDADLLGLGEHCALGECNQLDFLPFKCDACSKTFCLAHRSYGAHRCAAAAPTQELLVIVCPLCAESVRLRPGEAPDAAFDRHARGGRCDPRNYAARQAAAKARCPAKGCKERLTSVNTYACRSCRQSVCLRHRHGDDHQCPGRPVGGGGGGGGALAGWGAQALQAVGRLSGRGTAAAAGTAGGGGGGGAGGGAARGSASAASAAAARAAAAARRDDPGNSVRGTAERRRQQLYEQQQQPVAPSSTAGAAAGAVGSFFSSLFSPAAAQQATAAAAARAGAAPVIDLTGDDDGDAGGAQQRQQQPRQQQYPQQQQPRQQPRQQQQQPLPGGGAAYACHRCGAGFDDPVLLVEHDAACAASAGSGSARGGGTGGANCRLS